MPRSAGARLGVYEVTALIGEGGMGQVYRARDTKLNRDVALKVLPDAFLLDSDRLARFAREAQVLASLNHPNIAAIYGFEDSKDVQALVLELVEGPTLADRIAQGPIPRDESLAIARQVAEALEAAHEQGIIHRDLKPANISLRPDGTVKVLDFGLAKALEPTLPTSASVTASPTITTPPMMTGIGMILGTAAYMSPEQAKGRPADKRSDVWAFGCVLYELLTGKRPFEGEDVSDTLAAVFGAEPDWNALPPSLSPSIALLVSPLLGTGSPAPDWRRVDDALSSRRTTTGGGVGVGVGRGADRPTAVVADTCCSIKRGTDTNAHHPFWSRDGRELHYIPAAGGFAVVSITTHPTIAFGDPVLLSRGPLGFFEGRPANTRQNEAAPDGRVLAITTGNPSQAPAGVGQAQYCIVLNWAEELKACVSTK